MSLRVFATALGKLAVSVFITVVAGVLIILQLQYPNTPPPYELVPTIVPIVGAVCSAIGVALLRRSSKEESSDKMRWLLVAVLCAIAFGLTWYLTMFIILNFKGA